MLLILFNFPRTSLFISTFNFVTVFALTGYGMASNSLKISQNQTEMTCQLKAFYCMRRQLNLAVIIFADTTRIICPQILFITIKILSRVAFT